MFYLSDSSRSFCSHLCFQDLLELHSPPSSSLYRFFLPRKSNYFFLPSDFKPPSPPGGTTRKTRVEMTIEWSPDYCLVCDRQTLGGTYCSQACRLAELDPMPLDYTLSLDAEQSTQMMDRSSTVKSSSCNNTISSFGYAARRHKSQPSAGGIEKSSTTISPSPSRSSISSLRSNTSQSDPVTNQAKNDLRDYASCFDQVRHLKRRMTSF